MLKIDDLKNSLKVTGVQFLLNLKVLEDLMNMSERKEQLNREKKVYSIYFDIIFFLFCSCFESYADNENECPICAGKNRKLIEDLRHQEQVLFGLF